MWLMLQAEPTAKAKAANPANTTPSKTYSFWKKKSTCGCKQSSKKTGQKSPEPWKPTKKDSAYHLEDRLAGLSIKRQYVAEAARRANLNIERPVSWTDEDFYRFVDILRRISKPLLIVANKIDLPTAQANVERMKKLDYVVIPCSAEAELVLRRAAEKQLIDYKPGDKDFTITHPEKLSAGQIRALEQVKEKILKPNGTTGVQEAINTAYFKLLDMITVYPVEDLEHLTDHNGRVLPDAYLVPKGTTAHLFAYLIHSELGENFLYAIDARDKRRIGEDAILKDRDVISIVSAKKRS